MISENRRSDQRAYPRLKIFEPADLRVGRTSARVHMLDVSPSGTRLHVGTSMAVGAEVVLSWSGERRAARVMWANGPKCGLRFILPLDAAQIGALTAA